jgi:polyisoprenoid-binding protein YceI
VTAAPADLRTAAGTWSVSGSRTRLGFAVGNLGRTVHGTLPCSWGDVVVDASGAPVRARVGIDLRGVATGIDRRDADLCGPRFLDVDRRPTMTWTADRFTRGADGGWTATGTLSLRGTSAPLTVTGGVESLDPAGGSVRVLATAVLDRSAVGIRAPAPLVGRRVDITIDAWLTLARSHRTRLSRTLTAGALATVLLLAGCGSDDDPDEASAAAEVGTPSSAGGDVDAFCQGVVDFDALAPGGEDEPSPEQVAAFGEQVAGPVRVIAENAPPSAADAAATLEELQERLAEGDGSVFEDPLAFETLAAIEQAVADECEFTDVAVEAVDHRFEGLPATVPAGVTNFLMTNTSEQDEDHVMLVARPTDGQPITPEEFLADPEASFGRLEILGAAFAGPGALGGITLDLPPGEYLLICPISADETAPPHFVLGMISRLSVT